jgi:hypothetical protein
MDLSAYGYSYGLQDYTPGGRLIYRVTAKDSLGRQSQPALSNEVILSSAGSTDTAMRVGAMRMSDTTTSVAPAAITIVRPAMVAEPARLKVGDPLLMLASNSTFISLRLTNPHWTSLDESVVTVDAKGQVRARRPGFTYVIANGIAPDGSLASLVNRIDVAR